MASRRRCVCGCGRRAQHGVGHHVIYQQQLRKLTVRDVGPPDIAREIALIRDKRNLVPVALECHHAHHNGSRKLPLAVLPDGVFEFAGEVMGPGKAYDYLRRHYANDDPRHDALLAEWEASR